MVPSFSLRPDQPSFNRIRKVRVAVILSLFNLLSVSTLFPRFIRVGKKSLISPTAGLAFHEGPFSITVFIGIDCSAAICNIFVSFSSLYSFVLKNLSEESSSLCNTA